MKLGKWRGNDATVKVARKNKQNFDQAIKDLTERGYVVIWQHETMNFAELKRT